MDMDMDIDDLSKSSKGSSLPDADTPEFRDAFEQSCIHNKLPVKRKGESYLSTYTGWCFKIAFGTVNRLRQLERETMANHVPSAVADDDELGKIAYSLHLRAGRFLDMPTARSIVDEVATAVRKLPSQSIESENNDG